VSGQQQLHRRAIRNIPISAAEQLDSIGFLFRDIKRRNTTTAIGSKRTFQIRFGNRHTLSSVATTFTVLATQERTFNLIYCLIVAFHGSFCVAEQSRH
jgi:hypothetical protein